MSLSPAAPPPERPRSSWALRVVFGALLLALAAAAAAAAALMSFALLDLAEAAPRAPAVRVVERDGDPEVASVWDRHGPINVLLVGTDLGIGAGCKTSTYRLTDTLILVRFDPTTERAGLMSIPRDLYVPMPERGARKITTAYALGQKEDRGAEFLKRTIQRSLELPVHRHVLVDIAGFERIVDELGGVEIDVPPSALDPEIGLYDPAFPDGSCGTEEVLFKPGVQEMDGQRALQYARSRKTSSDFDRSRRQMDVLMALRERALSPSVITKAPGLLPALFDTVATDFTPREVLALVGPARDVDTGAIYRYPIDLDVVYDDWVVADGVAQAVLRLKPGAYQDLRARFLALEPPPRPEDPAGTPTPGADETRAGRVPEGGLESTAAP